MDRSRITELHLICPFDNVPSVLARGILSNKLQRKQVPGATSVANAEVQARRAAVRIPPKREPLHSYANLYVHARNAMMSTLRHLNDTLAVVRVSDDVLELPGVIVADRNAAADDVIFRPAAGGVAALVEDEVYAVWWNQSRDAKQKRCAEVLVPDRVPPEYVVGAYVRNGACQSTLAGICSDDLAVTVNASLYF